MVTRVSFWLLPAVSDRQVFQDLITQLAQAHDAPMFIPHVTVYSGAYDDDEDPRAILSQSLQGMSPVVLRVDSIRCTEQLTKTVFVQFQPAESLMHLSDRLQQLSRTPSGYHLDPHLSLIYKQMPEAEKQQVAKTILLPQTQVVFDAVGGIVSSKPMLTREDIENWSVQWRTSLL